MPSGSAPLTGWCASILAHREQQLISETISRVTTVLWYIDCTSLLKLHFYCCTRHDVPVQDKRCVRTKTHQSLLHPQDTTGCCLSSMTADSAPPQQQQHQNPVLEGVPVIDASDFLSQVGEARRPPCHVCTHTVLPQAIKWH